MTAYPEQTQFTGPEPFHALEAEQALIGAVLHNNEAFTLVADKIGPQHFFEGLHARIWETIGNQIAAGHMASLFTLAPVFRNDATMLELGGLTYLTGLWSGTVTVANSGGYAEAIVNAYKRREAARLIKELEAANAGSDNNSIANIRKSLADLLNGDSASENHEWKIAGAADLIVRKVNDVLMSGVVPDDGAPLSSPTLRRNLGSWKRGCLYVLGGRPAMGKSTVGLSWLLRTAYRSNVLFFSLEMSAEQLAKRALADIAFNSNRRITYQSIDLFEIGTAEMEAICEAQTRLADLRLVIDDRSGLTIDKIKAAAMREAQRLKAKGERLEVICIDHLGIMGMGDRYRGNQVAEIGEVTAGLKSLAKELDCAVIALMQLNRAVEHRDDKRPSLSDLRGSGTIEQDADVVMFIYREAYYLEQMKCDDPVDEEERQQKLSNVKNMLEVNIAKNRHGACARMEFFCDMGCGAVRDLDKAHA